jgi:phosphoglycerate dehydrogenase-like enzyme/predicted dehydrogenase
MATRALVIGAGETSTLMHLPVLSGLQARGRLELAEICDLRIDRASAAQAQFGFTRRSGDAYSALGRPDITAVYLFGDARLHHDLGMAALDRGLHVFVEKPIAPSAAQAREMAERARDKGLIAVGGHNRRFYRAIAEVRKRGRRAGWRFGEAVFHKPEFGRPPPFGASSWLTANGIHALDALLYVMGGLPDEMTALADGERYAALMRWPDGAQGVFLCDNAAGERREAYTFHAPGESCQIDDAGVRIAAAGQDDRLIAPTLGDGFDAEHLAFLDAIDSGVEPLHSLAALAPSLHLAELIEAGFSGRIAQPMGEMRPAPRVQPQPKRPAGGAMLVVNAQSLTTALALAPAGRPLVALEDVLQAPHPRPDIDSALLGTGPAVLTDDILDRLPNLRVAGLVGLSFARHQPHRLLNRGVTLVNAAQTYADIVAEFALGLAIVARRRGFLSDQAMRGGGWGTTPLPPGWKGRALRTAQGFRPALTAIGLDAVLLRAWRGTRPLHGLEAAPARPVRSLRGATVGLLGWGANARAFATRLLAVGATVAVFSEHADPDDIRQAGASPVSLGEALAAEIVSLHRGLTLQTQHFLGPAELARLRPGAVLINVARAGLIDPNALLARLKRGDIFACLDVFDVEPPAAADPLRRLPNVFLTSHIAGASQELKAAALKEVIDKIDLRLAGEPGPDVLRDRLRTMT